MNTTGVIGAYIGRWVKTADDPSLRADILSYLGALGKREGYRNIILAGPDGRLLLSLNPHAAELDVNMKQSIERAVSSRGLVFGDLFRCPVCNEVHLDVAAPILDTGGVPVAVLVAGAIRS